MLDTSRPILQPRVTYHVRTREWEVLEDWRYYAREGNFCVCRGFRFNLASIPRIGWGIVGPHELSIAAPLLHDWMYFFGGAAPLHSVTPYRTFGRIEVDRMFYGLMLREGVPPWKAGLAFHAVDIFGGGAWNKQGKMPVVGDSLDLGRKLLLEGVKLVGPSDFTVTLPNDYMDTYV